MIRTVQVLQQSANAIQRHARFQSAKIVRFDLKPLDPGSRAPQSETGTQHLVNQGLERLPGAPRFGLQAHRNVLVERQGRSHIMMLLSRHHDVNPSWVARGAEWNGASCDAAHGRRSTLLLDFRAYDESSQGSHA